MLNCAFQLRINLKRIQRQLGITTVFVTHDQEEESLSISDKVAVMDKGVIEQFASPEEIYSNPSTEFIVSSDSKNLSRLPQQEHKHSLQRMALLSAQPARLTAKKSPAPFARTTSS